MCLATNGAGITPGASCSATPPICTFRVRVKSSCSNSRCDNGDIAAVTAAPANAAVAPDAARTTISIVRGMVSDITLLHTSITASTTVATMTSVAAIATFPACRVDVDADHEVAHFNSDVAAVAPFSTISRTRAGQTSASREPIPRMIITVPMIRPVKALQAS
jgi:hypothetical protein